MDKLVDSIVGIDDRSHINADEEQNPAGDWGIKRFESEDATAFIEAACFIRCGESADTDRASHDARQSAEQHQIAVWVKECGVRSFKDAELAELTVISEKTSEHKVFMPLMGTRVTKVTWAGFYGQIPYWIDGRLDRKLALPSEYLDRQALQNEVFASDIRLEGVNVSERPSMIIGAEAGQPSFVISQRFIEAANHRTPIPSEQQIAEFMAEHGFEKTSGYFAWIRRMDGIAVVDAKADNFILSHEGVVPIDLQIARTPELIADEMAESSIIVV